MTRGRGVWGVQCSCGVAGDSGWSLHNRGSGWEGTHVAQLSTHMNKQDARLIVVQRLPKPVQCLRKEDLDVEG